VRAPISLASSFSKAARAAHAVQVLDRREREVKEHHGAHAAAKVEQMSEGAAPAPVSDEDAAASLTFSEGGGIVRIAPAGAKAAGVVRAPPRSTRRSTRRSTEKGFSNTQIALGIFGIVSLIAVAGIVVRGRSSGE
jgi:hypothetical protein